MTQVANNSSVRVLILRHVRVTEEATISSEACKFAAFSKGCAYARLSDTGERLDRHEDVVRGHCRSAVSSPTGVQFKLVKMACVWNCMFFLSRANNGLYHRAVC